MNKYIASFALIFLLIITDTGQAQNSLRWRSVPTIPSAGNIRYEDMSFINATTGWAIISYSSGSQSVNNVYRTKDGGESWAQFTDTSFGGLRSIGFADSLHGWIGTLNWPGTVMYRTVNGGENWEKVITTGLQDSLGVCGISVVSRDIVYGCGRYYGPARFFKTTNGGVNWTIKNLSPYITTLIDCHFFNKDSGFVVGGIGSTFGNRSGAILFTSDGGETWVNRATTPPRGQWCWKISFPDRLNGYVSLEKISGSPVYFYKTTNGGETWEEKTFLNTAADEEGIGFINASTGWLGGWFFNTYKTTDGGNSWNSDPWGFNLNRIRVINDTLAYGAGARIYKFSRDSIVGITQTSSIVPEDFELQQNYPNPFNPSTIISYKLKRQGDVILRIHDIVGRQVSELVNTRQNAGTYEATFSATNIPNGVYSYSLHVDGVVVASRRMTIVK